jgi:hypothetical protein
VSISGTAPQRFPGTAVRVKPGVHQPDWRPARRPRHRGGTPSSRARDKRETVGIAVLRITHRPPVPHLDDAIDRGLHLTAHVLPSSRPAANRRSDTRASKAFSLSSGGPRSTADGCAETTTGSDIAVGRRASATGRRSTSPRCAVSRNVLPINDCAAVAPSRTTTSGRTDIISATNHGRQATTSVQGELEMFHRVGDVQPIPVDPGRRERLVQQLARRAHERRAGLIPDVRGRRSRPEHRLVACRYRSQPLQPWAAAVRSARLFVSGTKSAALWAAMSGGYPGSRGHSPRRLPGGLGDLGEAACHRSTM